MKTIFIVPIEPIDQRYTKQWYENIPEILKEAGAEVVTIDGGNDVVPPMPGTFLNFGQTNAYKANQVVDIAKKFSDGTVKSGEKFLVTDAWNFNITAIRYMSDLLKIPVEIHSIWHAGNYDPTDILGMHMDKEWASNQERAWYYASDFNYFATNFHKNMFLKNLDIRDHSKAFRSGQPHTPLINQISARYSNKKNNLVVWPHRYNEDKQPDIAENLKNSLQHSFMITQPLNLSKDSFYDLISGSKVLFSCSLHENLGISMMEGVLAGAIPIVPDRCSYKEMYLDSFKYPHEWTESYESYIEHKNELIEFINYRINHYDEFVDHLRLQKNILIKNYLTPTVMVEKLMEIQNA